MALAAASEKRYMAEASPTILASPLSSNSFEYSASEWMKRNFGRSSAKKQSSFELGKKMSGWVRRYSTQAVVPHFGAPTMKRFGTRAEAEAAPIVRASGPS